MVDDHPLFRSGVVRAISEWSELELVGEAADGDAALLLIREVDPEVVLLDVRLPKRDGLQILKALTLERASARVLFLSAFADGPVVYAALAAGAAGYLSKDEDAEDICRAVVAAAGGETVLAAAAKRDAGSSPPASQPAGA